MSFCNEATVRAKDLTDVFPLHGVACVIEPDDERRADLASKLRRMGYRTYETGSASVGAFIVSQVRVQVVLVDVMTPDGGGLKFIRELRKTAPGAVIVALSEGNNLPLIT